MRTVPTIILALALLGFTGTGARAQERPSAVAGDVRGAIDVDGVLDEASWVAAAQVGALTMIEPLEGAPPTEATEVRVLADAGNLYIGIRAYDSEPDKIVGQLTRRDQYSPPDWLVVSFDSYYDRRTAFEFRVNPAGVERAAFLPQPGVQLRDVQIRGAILADVHPDPVIDRFPLDLGLAGLRATILRARPA